jgi:hypothetical protein
MAYLEHFYRTGEKLEFLTLWRAGTHCIDCRTVPTFALHKRSGRGDGIVI